MTNQEVNEFLAERMFGFKKGEDFGSSIGLPLNHPLYTQAIDYIENWQEVIEILIESGETVRLFQNGQGWKYACQINKGLICDLDTKGARAGTTLGEAICRAAVAFIKAED